MSNIVALFDACVFYPAPVRDLLMQLALTDLFRAKWSASIHDEWIAAIMRHRPDIPAERLKRTRALMDSHVRDCLVTGFEYLIPVLELPDPGDRHVLAAAIHGGASIIVTYNLHDFPIQTLRRFDIEAQHPDLSRHASWSFPRRRWWPQRVRCVSGFATHRCPRGSIWIIWRSRLS